MTTVVFACKSNSCRSQMAEGWAKKWIEDERRKMVRDQLESDSIDRLKGFLDNLAVFSVALDETSVIATAGEGVSTMVLKRDEKVDSESMKNHGSSPCDDHMCSPPPQLRKSVKAKAIWAMAEDGVDISKSVPKTIHDVLPEILGKVNRSWSDGGKCFDQYTSDNGPDGMQGRKWEKLLSFIGLLRDLLEQSSREMGMAYAGVEKNNNDISTSKEEDESTTDNLIVKNEIAMSSHHNKVVDSLIVLCSCPDSLKRVIGEMSKETLEWDISAPTSAAKSGEGDSAYLRVSHQIRNNVNEFMNGLKYNYLSETSMTCLAGKCSDSHGVHLPVKTLSLVEEVLAD